MREYLFSKTRSYSAGTRSSREITSWRSEQAARHTETGLLLVMIGLLVGLSPAAFPAGVLLVLAGAVLIVAGRTAFGPDHSRNTFVGLGLYILGMTTLELGELYVSSNLATLQNAFFGTDIAGTLNGTFQTFITIMVVSVFLSGMGLLLLPYAINSDTGRTLLWAGYILNILATLAIAIVFLPTVGSLADTIRTRGLNSSSLQQIQLQLQTLQFLSAVPSVLYAIAYYIARSLVETGRIPEQTKPRRPITVGQ